MRNNVLYFSSIPDHVTSEVGKVRINENDFIYSQKPLELWYRFDGKNISLDLRRTYIHFEFKRFLKSQTEFLNQFKWDHWHKKFSISSFIHAVNHNTRKECFTVSAPAAQASWICRKL